MKMVGGQLFQVNVVGKIQHEDGGRATLPCQISNFCRAETERKKLSFAEVEMHFLYLATI